MAKKPHVKLVNQKISSDIKWSYKPRFVPPVEDDVEAPKDYSRMAFRFRKSIENFKSETSIRHAARTIDVPEHIDHIDIRFQDSFNLKDFGKSYLSSFGLEAVRLTEFNKRVLFAISDNGLFEYFIEQLQLFIRWAEGENDLQFDQKVIFIESFQLLSSDRIVNYTSLKAIVKFSLAESLYNFQRHAAVTSSLLNFLNERGIKFTFDEYDLILEAVEINEAQIKQIVDNFDVILSVTSTLSTVISPSKFNIPERSYGFTISNPDEDLPLVGIIDTGVDARTPLAPLIVAGYDYTGTNATEDNEDHGTAVAALAVLGNRPYRSDYRNSIEADAKIVSIKVMNQSPAPLMDSTVLEAIRRVKQDHGNIKIFVLTITHEDHKKYNEPHSDYAYQLDKLSHELEILIFISVGNLPAHNDLQNYDLSYYDQEKTNLQCPSESMNNVSVGAYADNLETGPFLGIAAIREFPAIFSRSDYLRLESHFTPRKINKHLRNPDLLLPGGDYEPGTFWFGQGLDASMQVLSANPAVSFYRQIGTSFSAPLAANLALRVLKLYPDLKPQSIKALLLNGCDRDIYSTGNTNDDRQLNKVVGAGMPIENAILYSTNNRVTFLIERSLSNKELLVIPVRVPDYLSQINKDRGLLKFTITLCFSFLPDKDNQLAYCPVFVAFSVFRNATPQEIKDQYSGQSKLRNSFSQDGYATAKPSMYSNVQKMSFRVSKSDIISENGTFMLAIHSFISPHIKAGTAEIRKRIGTPTDVSIAMTIEEIQPANKVSNKLYDEIVAINTIENILDTSAQLDLDA